METDVIRLRVLVRCGEGKGVRLGCRPGCQDQLLFSPNSLDKVEIEIVIILQPNPHFASRWQRNRYLQSHWPRKQSLPLAASTISWKRNQAELSALAMLLEGY